MQSIKNKFENISITAKAAFCFMLCSTIQKAISFITTPVFTRIMTTEEFGRFNVYVSWFNTFLIITTLKLDGAVFNKCMSKFRDSRKGVVLAFQNSTSIVTCICFILYIIFQKQINSLTELSTVITILMFVQLFFQPAYSFWLGIERYEYRYKTFTSITLLWAILNTGVGVLAVLCIESLDKGTARIISNIAIQTVFGMVLYIINLQRGRSAFSKNQMDYAIKFNIPLIPHYMSQYILDQMDRIMIQKMVGVTQVGIYTVAYNVGTAMKIVTNSLVSAITPWYYDLLERKSYSEINKKFESTVYIAMIPVFLFIGFAPELMSILATAEYKEAMYVIPPVCVSNVFLLMYSFFSIIEFFYEANKFSMFATGAGALLNIILNYSCIKQYGYIAAGYTTMICYALFAVAHFFYSQYVLNKHSGQMVFKIGTVMLLILINIGYAVLMSCTYQNTLIRYCAVGVLILLIIAFRNKLYETVKLLSIKEK